ncbi:MAG: hypothetical protein ACKVOH_04115 [Chlamydiales bacterium]
MKKLFVFLCSLVTAASLPLIADETTPQHFHITMENQPGDWELALSQVKINGQYFEIWDRQDLGEGTTQERIIVVSSPTTKAHKVKIRALMRKSMFPVKYVPGTKTEVHREVENEAVFEWRTPNGHHSLVRLLVEPGTYHSVTYLHKGKERLDEEEMNRRVDFLDSLNLTYSS